MDRRTFVTSGMWLTAAGCVSPWIARAAQTQGTIAVFDSTLAQGRAFAAYVAHAARGNPRTFDVGDDIGALWYTTLAPHLAKTPTVLVGVTRPSDFFVLTQCVPDSARATQDGVTRSNANAHESIAFLIDCTGCGMPDTRTA